MSAKTQLFVGAVRHHALVTTTRAWLFFCLEEQRLPGTGSTSSLENLIDREYLLGPLALK
jgi:hypothetical protein